MNAQRWVLASIDDDPVPAVLRETVSGRYTVLADTIVFANGGQGYHSRALRVEPFGAQPPETTRSTTAFTYEMPGASLASSAPAGLVVITYKCPDDVLADCIPGPHLTGLRNASALTLRSTFESPEKELRYVRR
jgi:hypothetical protein